jgi:hypothetical protein
MAGRLVAVAVVASHVAPRGGFGWHELWYGLIGVCRQGLQQLVLKQALGIPGENYKIEMDSH